MFIQPFFFFHLFSRRCDFSLRGLSAVSGKCSITYTEGKPGWKRVSGCCRRRPSESNSVCTHSLSSPLPAHCPPVLTRSIPSAEGHHAECYKIRDFITIFSNQALPISLTWERYLSGQDRVSRKQSYHVYTKTTPSENKNPLFRGAALELTPSFFAWGQLALCQPPR